LSTEKIMKSLERLVESIANSNEVDPQKAKHVFKLVLEYSLRGGNGLTDIELEELTGYKQAEIRRILRIFYDAKIITYNKSKHPELDTVRYYWKIDLDSMNMTLLKMKKAVLSKLKQRLEYEYNNEFYKCPEDGSRYTFSEAFNQEFKCPKCGAILQREDNSEIIKELNNVVKRLEEEIKRDERKVYSS